MIKREHSCEHCLTFTVVPGNVLIDLSANAHNPPSNPCDISVLEVKKLKLREIK